MTFINQNSGAVHVKEADMEFLFKYADILSLHVPETDLTRGRVDEAYLDRFEKEIYLINTSRGKVVNTTGTGAFP